MMRKITKHNLLLLCLGFCTVFYGCTEAEEPELENDLGIKIGEEMEGGLLAHIFQVGEAGYVQGETHGIIVAKSDLAVEPQWGCNGKEVGGTSRDVGSGKLNTELVLAFHNNLPDYYTNPTQCSPSNDGTVAANEASKFNVDGYNDWFIPTRGEAAILFSNKDVIGGFSAVEYWSSCESNNTNACVISFETGNTFSAIKSEHKKVRVIRYF